MAVPGIIMRLAQPAEGKESPPAASLAPLEPCPGVEAMITFKAHAEDELTPKYNTTYFIKDITPILNSSSYFEEDMKSHSAELESAAWEVCSFINGRDFKESKGMSREPHVLPKAPAVGSCVVSNGGTPRSGFEQDYHDWYNDEHSGLLTRVPGWNNCRRYAHAKTYGDTPVATFYGWNYYDKENGLGGPEWQDTQTKLTFKVRGNAAKPNLRRIWEVTGSSM